MCYQRLRYLNKLLNDLDTDYIRYLICIKSCRKISESISKLCANIINIIIEQYFTGY